jgi:hypothetical protein
LISAELAPVPGRDIWRGFMVIHIEDSKYLTEAENLFENANIQEMATPRKSDNGLPVSLYLDDAASWSKSVYIGKE